jgi:hypothetical protein
MVRFLVSLAAGMPAPRLAPVANQPHGHLMGQQARHPPPPPLPPYQLQGQRTTMVAAPCSFSSLLAPAVLSYGSFPGFASCRERAAPRRVPIPSRPTPSGVCCRERAAPRRVPISSRPTPSGVCCRERAAPRRVPIPSRPTPARSPEDDHGRRGRATANPRWSPKKTADLRLLAPLFLRAFELLVSPFLALLQGPLARTPRASHRSSTTGTASRRDSCEVFHGRR